MFFDLASGQGIKNGSTGQAMVPIPHITAPTPSVAPLYGTGITTIILRFCGSVDCRRNVPVTNFNKEGSGCRPTILYRRGLFQTDTPDQGCFLGGDNSFSAVARHSSILACSHS